MTDWRLLKRLRDALAALVDEILQLALYAHQALPWLFARSSSRSPR